jgi:hypothetical protein
MHHTPIKKVESGSHNIHVHAMMIGEDLSARDKLEGTPFDRWRSGQKCSAWED